MVATPPISVPFIRDGIAGCAGPATTTTGDMAPWGAEPGVGVAVTGTPPKVSTGPRPCAGPSGGRTPEMPGFKCDRLNRPEASPIGSSSPGGGGSGAGPVSDRASSAAETVPPLASALAKPLASAALAFSERVADIGLPSAGLGPVLLAGLLAGKTGFFAGPSMPPLATAA